jgi:hypothetical protein
MSHGLFNAAQVLPQPSQNEFAFFSARHFGAKQLKDKWISRLSNPPDRRIGSFGFHAAQASTIDKCLWILADGSTTKLGEPVAGQAQND